ncbi:hypothetical protein LP419_20625 [Massilia sp. H-1]|nr:hypothetical protein LP419_20625 [Massilia sp. H-1]
MNINSLAPLICIAALLHSAPALAAEPQYFGAKDCQIRVIDTYTNYKAIWKGPCKDGFAEGQGVLIMKHEGKELSRYEGGMQRGLRQGPGYVSYASGDQYEGGFKDSRQATARASIYPRMATKSRATGKMENSTASRRRPTPPAAAMTAAGRTMNFTAAAGQSISAAR